MVNKISSEDKDKKEECRRQYIPSYKYRNTSNITKKSHLQRITPNKDITLYLAMYLGEDNMTRKRQKKIYRCIYKHIYQTAHARTLQKRARQIASSRIKTYYISTIAKYPFVAHKYFTRTRNTFCLSAVYYRVFCVLVPCLDTSDVPQPLEFYLHQRWSKKSQLLVQLLRAACHQINLFLYSRF